MDEQALMMIKDELRVLSHAIIIATLLTQRERAIDDAGPIAAKIYDKAYRAAHNS